MQSEKSPWFHIITGVVFCFIIANLVYLNMIALQSKNEKSVAIAVTPTIGPSQLLLTPTIAPTMNPSVTIEPTSLPTKKTSPLVKEYFIPFGTGTTSATEWENLLGLQATIDGSSYPNTKSITFEVSLHNVAAGQAVYIRLFNATDNAPVWSSDVIYTGGNTSELLVSRSINLANGNKLYKVQVKTQLGSPVMIDNSRLHITLE